MDLKVQNGVVEWANDRQNGDFDRVFAHLHARSPINHWSRQFEYPWIMLNGNFAPGHWVLDVGGGDNPLGTYVADYGSLVVNLDPDRDALERIGDPRILRVCARLDAVNFFPGSFDRVICCSVVEHCPDPVAMIDDMYYRLLKPGGKLLLTMDVTPYSRFNHTMTAEMAKGFLAKMFGLPLPDLGPGVIYREFDEQDPLPGEKPTVPVCVLCVSVEKPR